MDNAYEALAERMQRSLQIQWPGISLQKLHEGYARIALPVRPEFQGGGGTDALNGSILSYLMNTAMELAVDSLDPTGTITNVTISLNLSYLHMIRGDQVEAEGRVTRRGGTVVFTEGAVYNKDGMLCVEGSGVYRLFREG